MAQSNYKPHTRIPKDSRRIDRKGDHRRGGGEDAGIWFTCWNCGMINKDGRSTEGGPTSRAGTAHESVVEAPYQDDAVNSPNLKIGGIGISHKLMEIGADGEPIGVRHAHASLIIGGCPFCGTKNWRGIP